MLYNRIVVTLYGFTGIVCFTYHDLAMKIAIDADMALQNNK